MEIIWAKSALNSLLKIYEYIYESSPQNAHNIITEIEQKVAVLAEQPDRYKPDSYKKNNTGAYRAFEYKRIRISYKVSFTRIEVVRVKHTRQRPQHY
jgi:plasmid stabilization system protein ParE